MGELLYPLGLTEEEKASLPVPDYSGPSYRMNYSRGDIRSYLKDVNDCVRRGLFVVLGGDPEDTQNTRRKNIDFVNTFGLWNVEAQKRLLLGMSEDEFCHVVTCNDRRLLYVFCIDRTLYKAASGYELARVYVKHDYSSGSNPFDVVVSLHALELPIMKAFGD